MSKRLTTTSLACALLAGFLACGENPVGRKCFLSVSDAGPGRSIVSSPALDCPSRICLRTPQERDLPDNSEYADLCTAECQSNSDCDKVPESPCVGSFVCGVAVTTGPFCCRKMCICSDYVNVPEEGELPEPEVCNPDVPANTCINLEGRS